MPPIKTEGFVLKKVNFRETSVILTLFTRELGKIKGVLKGVRSEKSKISPLTFTPGAYIFTLVYKKKNELNLLSSPNLINFFEFKDRIFLKIYFLILNLIDTFLPEFQKEESIFFLLQKTVDCLQTNKRNYLVFLGFKIKFIEILGYGIKIDRCTKCGIKINLNFLSPKCGGVVCKNCGILEPDCVKISNKILSIIKFIKKVDLKNLDVLRIKKEEAEKINYLCNLVLYYHTNLNFVWWENEKDIFK
ncbi:MAG: DNA repair protein RecO [Candidatus Omnitrophica bacterium]|nr:DNA repair protein RecO [Candidatus Omnitrophota bacterium]MCM8806649.1 DNA repair protein RecO [Candidatus Omnitrophota bacterium]